MAYTLPITEARRKADNYLNGSTSSGFITAVKSLSSGTAKVVLPDAHTTIYVVTYKHLLEFEVPVTGETTIKDLGEIVAGRLKQEDYGRPVPIWNTIKVDTDLDASGSCKEFPFLNLNKDLKLRIMLFLSVNTLCSLSMVCSELNSLCNLDDIWKDNVERKINVLEGLQKKYESLADWQTAATWKERYIIFCRWNLGINMHVPSGIRISYDNCTVSGSHTLAEYCFFENSRIVVYPAGIGNNQPAVLTLVSLNKSNIFGKVLVLGRDKLVDIESQIPLGQNHSRAMVIFPWRNNTERDRAFMEYCVWDGCEATVLYRGF